MPGMGGLEAIRRIRARFAESAVVVFTMHDDPMIATRALKAGATAFVTKTSAPRDLVEAVRRAGQGECYLSQDIAQAIALCSLDTQKSALTALTAREFEIFRMLSRGQGVRPDRGVPVLIAQVGVQLFPAHQTKARRRERRGPREARHRGGPLPAHDARG